MKPKWQTLASLAQEIRTLEFQFFDAVFASKEYSFKNIFDMRSVRISLAICNCIGIALFDIIPQSFIFCFC